MASSLMLLSARVVFSHLSILGTDAASWTFRPMVPPPSDTSYSSSSLWTVGSLQMPTGTCVTPARGRRPPGLRTPLLTGVSLTSYLMTTEDLRPNARCPLGVLDSLRPNFISSRAERGLWSWMCFSRSFLLAYSSDSQHSGDPSEVRVAGRTKGAALALGMASPIAHPFTHFLYLSVSSACGPGP